MDDVLIVGAGPTGLMAAVWLAANGIRARVVDPKPGPTPETRAVSVQARTLELFSMLGIADRALARGRRTSAINFWVEGKIAARVPLGQIGAGLSPFPFILILSQSDTEAILYERLKELGGEVEWGTRVESVEGNRVDFGESKASYRFILGCDGASSVVRRATGLGFPGGTYEGRFFVADVDASGRVVPGEVNIALSDRQFLAFFPLREANRYRIVGLIPKGIDPDTATIDAIRPLVASRVGAQIDRARWFSVYRVHHRVVERFRSGPVFLLGDAAHVHSPVGGQGMNTGLGDAANLAWKIVEVLRHGANDWLLDTYEEERRPFALSLVHTTDRVFELAVGDSSLSRAYRKTVVPLVFKEALRIPAARRLAFRTVSQTAISYADGSLAQGDLGRFHSGDRLPPYAGDGARPDRWRLILAPDAPAEALAWAERHGIAVRTVSRGRVALLVRPDGYIGLTALRFDSGIFDDYLRNRVGRPV